MLFYVAYSIQTSQYLLCTVKLINPFLLWVLLKLCYKFYLFSHYWYREDWDLAGITLWDMNDFSGYVFITSSINNSSIKTRSFSCKNKIHHQTDRQK